MSGRDIPGAIVDVGVEGVQQELAGGLFCAAEVGVSLVETYAVADAGAVFFCVADFGECAGGEVRGDDLLHPFFGGGAGVHGAAGSGVFGAGLDVDHGARAVRLCEIHFEGLGGQAVGGVAAGADDVDVLGRYDEAACRSAVAGE